MKNQTRYCPSCGRKANVNNKNPKKCPSCGQPMMIMDKTSLDQIVKKKDK